MTGSRHLRWGLGAVGAVLGVGAVAAGAWAWRNLTAFDREWRAVVSAGFVEKRAEIDGVTLTYGEGPDNGPPLLLIHGQATDWKSYAPVLPALAEDFQVIAVDVPGHGGSNRWAGHYTAPEVGRLLQSFLVKVIDEPAVVSGHSSGGQLAAWIAGHDDAGLVRAVALEDPPMFATELPRATRTWNWVDLASTAHDFLESDATDWVAWQWEHQRMWRFFGDSADRIIRHGLSSRTPGSREAVSVWYLPPSLMGMQRTFVDYDPHFGQAFHDGTWNDGFDQAATLAGIQVPTVYLHAPPSYGDDGVMQGAASEDEVARVMANLQHGRLVTFDSGHNIHGEDPAGFIRELRSLL